MSSPFESSLVRSAVRPQDRGRLQELGSHQLLRGESKSAQIASFDQVRELGRWMLEQRFSSVLPSSAPVPELFARYDMLGKGPMFGKLALGAEPSSQYPAAIEVVQAPERRDLRVHVVSIHFEALSPRAFSERNDQLLALAAAAAAAPQFLFALEEGVESTHCATKKKVATSVSPDHGTPLAVVFDAFGHSQNTMTVAESALKRKGLSLQEATHVHGQSESSARAVARAAGGSGVASGVPIRTFLRSELPKHALFVQTRKNELGQEELIGMRESLREAKLQQDALSFVSAALAFTSLVVGDSNREKMIEKVFNPGNAEVPLWELLRP